MRLSCRGVPALYRVVLSAVSGKGVRETLFAITKEIGKAETREQEDENAERPPSWQP